MSEGPVEIVGFITVGSEGVTWVDDEGVSGPVQLGPIPESAKQWLDGLPRTKVTFSGLFDTPNDAT